jgi:hypothetical protein
MRDRHIGNDVLRCDGSRQSNEAIGTINSGPFQIRQRPPFTGSNPLASLFAAELLERFPSLNVLAIADKRFDATFRIRTSAG